MAMAASILQASPLSLNSNKNPRRVGLLGGINRLSAVGLALDSRKRSLLICHSALKAKCSEGQTQTVTRESPTITQAPVHFHHHQQQQQQQQLHMFWANQMQEIEQTTDFKNHTLPLARIKKIMKADEDVRMISAEAPVIFAKACEMFILELTLRAWIHTEENKRRTLQKNDIAAAISRTDVFDFLVDIIPRDELKEEGLGVTKGTIPTVVGSPPYYYLQQQGMMPWAQGNPEQHHDQP